MKIINHILTGIVCILFISCSNLSDKGEQSIKDFEKKFSCYYINTGIGKSGTFNKSSIQITKHFLGITIVGCSKEITFDNLEEHEKTIREFAESIFFEYMDRDKIDYVEVIYKMMEDGSNAKNFTYRLGGDNKLYLEKLTTDKPYSPF